MATIVPAILPTSRHDLDEKLARLVGIATDVQVDVVDGHFATPASWPYVGGFDLAQLAAEGGTIPLFEQFHIEMDLMTQKPEEVTGSWIAAGATRILAHVESTNYLPQLVTDLRVKYGHEKGFANDFLSFGLALNIDTDLGLLEQYLGDIDYVQFMGIKNIGKQSQPFATEVLNKIAVFRKNHPDMQIQVDGGVNFESAPLLLAAGVSRLVVGSALWKAPDLKEAYGKFVALTEQHGLYE
jgi:ribulose-phosphate 3-epimerase